MKKSLQENAGLHEQFFKQVHTHTHIAHFPKLTPLHSWRARVMDFKQFQNILVAAYSRGGEAGSLFISPLPHNCLAQILAFR